MHHLAAFGKCLTFVKNSYQTSAFFLFLDMISDIKKKVLRFNFIDSQALIKCCLAGSKFPLYFLKFTFT